MAAAGDASVRMQRMLLILKKALDVSVHGASSVDLRATIEAAAGVDAALLARLPSGAEADELAATSVLSLRGKMEDMFEWLCEEHGVNDKLLALEQLIAQAEHAQLRELAERKEREKEAKKRAQQPQEEAEPLTPEQLVRVERLRVLEDERKQLEELAADMEARNDQLRAEVEARRAAAAADVDRLQHVVAQLDQVGHLARNYASAP